MKEIPEEIIPSVVKEMFELLKNEDCPDDMVFNFPNSKDTNDLKNIGLRLEKLGYTYSIDDTYIKIHKKD